MACRGGGELGRETSGTNCKTVVSLPLSFTSTDHYSSIRHLFMH